MIFSTDNPPPKVPSLERVVVQRWSQYKNGNAAFAHDKDADRPFDSRAVAEAYTSKADSGIGGDTRYRYVIEPAPVLPGEATRPFAVGAGGFVRDANRDLVIVCSPEPGLGCDAFYSERLVEEDAFFICPKCGRLGQRMEEATPADCGITVEPAGQPES